MDVEPKIGGFKTPPKWMVKKFMVPKPIKISHGFGGVFPRIFGNTQKNVTGLCLMSKMNSLVFSSFPILNDEQRVATR